MEKFDLDLNLDGFLHAYFYISCIYLEEKNFFKKEKISFKLKYFQNK